MMRWIWVLVAAMALCAGGCGKDETDSVPAGRSEAEPTAAREESRAEQPQPVQRSQEPAAATESESGNRPPVVESVRLTPIDAVPGSEIEVQVVARDPEHDPVMLEYEWYRNKEKLHGELFDRLATDGFKKGDYVWVKVAPFDGEKRGKAVESAPVLIHNRPPEITSSPPTGLSDGQYTYQVEADDPDDDPLEYSLEGAPPGMEINAESGLMTWEVPEDQADGFQVRITVSDGDARAYQSFSMKVAPESR